MSYLYIFYSIYKHFKIRASKVYVYIRAGVRVCKKLLRTRLLFYSSSRAPRLFTLRVLMPDLFSIAFRKRLGIVGSFDREKHGEVEREVDERVFKLISSYVLFIARAKKGPAAQLRNDVA